MPSARLHPSLGVALTGSPRQLSPPAVVAGSHFHPYAGAPDARSPLTREEAERALAKLIKREKPVLGALALSFKLHPADGSLDSDPWEEFLAVESDGAEGTSAAESQTSVGLASR